jgi:hypothetical protein
LRELSLIKAISCKAGAFVGQKKGGPLFLREIRLKEGVNKRRQSRTSCEEHYCPEHQQDNDYWQKPKLFALPQEHPNLF